MRRGSEYLRETDIMLQNFRDRHPVYFSLISAAFAAGFGYLFLMFGADWDSTRMPSDAAIRICFLAWKKGKQNEYMLGTKKQYSILQIAKMFKTKIRGTWLQLY